MLIDISSLWKIKYANAYYMVLPTFSHRAIIYLELCTKKPSSKQSYYAFFVERREIIFLAKTINTQAI